MYFLLHYRLFTRSSRINRLVLDHSLYPYPRRFSSVDGRPIDCLLVPSLSLAPSFRSLWWLRRYTGNNNAVIIIIRSTMMMMVLAQSGNDGGHLVVTTICGAKCKWILRPPQGIPPRKDDQFIYSMRGAGSPQQQQLMIPKLQRRMINWKFSSENRFWIGYKQDTRQEVINNPVGWHVPYLPPTQINHHNSLTWHIYNLFQCFATICITFHSYLNMKQWWWFVYVLTIPFTHTQNPEEPTCLEPDDSDKETPQVKLIPPNNGWILHLQKLSRIVSRLKGSCFLQVLSGSCWNYTPIIPFLF